MEEWNVGDYESDIHNLRLVVAESHAQLDLQQKLRLDLLDEFARQRREIIPDIRRFLIRPFFFMAMLLLSTRLSSLYLMKNIPDLTHHREYHQNQWFSIFIY